MKKLIGLCGVVVLFVAYTYAAGGSGPRYPTCVFVDETTGWILILSCDLDDNCCILEADEDHPQGEPLCCPSGDTCTWASTPDGGADIGQCVDK